MATLLVLPNTLFKKKYIPNDVVSVVIWEHPQYFTKYKYNKKRLILHRASMQYYYDLVKKDYDDNVTYIEYNKNKIDQFQRRDIIDKKNESIKCFLYIFYKKIS